MSSTMELGVAYLWVGELESARDHFVKAIDEAITSYSCLFAMAGAALWCLGDQLEADEMWRAGLKSAYADAAGNTTIPLLLYFAAVHLEDAAKLDIALGILTKKQRDRRSAMWPGPVAAYVLGTIDLEELNRRAKDADEGDNAEFYKAVVCRRGGDRRGYRAAMRTVGNLPWSDYDSDKQIFLGRLWGPEFYLARAITQGAK